MCVCARAISDEKQTVRRASQAGGELRLSAEVGFSFNEMEVKEEPPQRGSHKQKVDVSVCFFHFLIGLKLAGEKTSRLERYWRDFSSLLKSYFAHSLF